MQKKVTVYCGAPGSGKSTLVAKDHPRGTVCSSDHYFLSDRGEYRFDPSLLPEAHAACLKKFVRAVTLDIGGDVVVDNTNTTVAEIAPYAALALAYGWDLDIVLVRCDWSVVVERNAGRAPAKRVPEDVLDAMYQRVRETFDKRPGYSATLLPPWWPWREVRS